MERRRIQWERWRAKGDQQGAQREQRDPKWEPNGWQKATEMKPKGAKGPQRARSYEQERKSGEKGTEKHAD
jgi:hypothetical protein